MNDPAVDFAIGVVTRSVLVVALVSFIFGYACSADFGWYFARAWRFLRRLIFRARRK